MYLDTFAEFADAVIPSGSAGSETKLGEDIDLGSPGKDGTANTFAYPGDGRPVYLVVNVDTDLTSSGTITFNLKTHTAASLTAGTTLASSASFTKADLDAGDTVWVIALPQATYDRYLGVTYTSTTGAEGAGRINAFLTLDASRWIALPDGQ